MDYSIFQNKAEMRLKRKSDLYVSVQIDLESSKKYAGSRISLELRIAQFKVMLRLSIIKSSIYMIHICCNIKHV